MDSCLSDEAIMRPELCLKFVSDFSCVKSFQFEGMAIASVLARLGDLPGNEKINDAS